MFICATRSDELFLLGAIEVNEVERERGRGYAGHYRASGHSISGPFGIIPLGGMKWKLRFYGESDRLSKASPVAMQVMSHRRLDQESAELLLGVFKNFRERQAQLQGVFGQEGKLMRKMVSVRERDPRIRRAAILKHGRLCMVCGLDFAEFYGEEARDCIHVHHLHLVGHAPTRGRKATLDDVIVACPNCHAALHSQPDPSAWRRLKRTVESRRLSLP